MRPSVKTVRHTIQKSTVLDYLKKVKVHPSAETVYKEVKKKMPSISKGTVYRILNNFKEDGQIQEISTAISRYDGDNSMHAHFICSDCGNIFDIFENCTGCAVLNKAEAKVGKVKYYQMHFYGICKKCRK